MRPLLLCALLAALSAPAAAVEAPADPDAPEDVGGVPFNPHCRRLTRPAPMSEAAKKQFEALFRELTQNGPQASSPGPTEVTGLALLPTGQPELVQGVLTEVPAGDENEGPIQKLVIRRAWDDSFTAGSLRESSNGVSRRQDFWHFEVSLTTHRLIQVRRTILTDVPGQRPRMYCMAPASPYAQRRWLDVVTKLRDASIPRVEI